MINFLLDILKVSAPQIDGLDCCDVALDLGDVISLVLGLADEMDLSL